MKIERTLDKVIFTDAEVQQIMKKHIMDKLSREVFGDVCFQQSNGSHRVTSAYAQLQDGPGCAP